MFCTSPNDSDDDEPCRQGSKGGTFHFRKVPGKGRVGAGCACAFNSRVVFYYIQFASRLPTTELCFVILIPNWERVVLLAGRVVVLFLLLSYDMICTILYRIRSGKCCMHFILIITYVYVITYVCMLSISWVSKGRVRQNTAV